MARTKKGYYFLLSLLLIVGGLSLLILAPFFSWIVFAFLLAVVFYPLKQKIEKKCQPYKWLLPLSSLLTFLVIIAVVIAPLGWILGEIYSEVEDLYTYLSQEGNGVDIFSLKKTVDQAFSKLMPNFSLSDQELRNLIATLFKALLSQIDAVFANIMRISVGIFISLWALLYFLKDGKKIQEFFISLSPLSDANNRKLTDQVRLAIQSIFIGMIAVAIFQGSVAGVGLALFSVPSPFLWGCASIIAALVPGIGTGLVLIPAIIYLYFKGLYFQAVGLIFWGLIPVGLVDNFLRPFLMGNKMQIHPFVVLIAVLGGISTFGVVGLVLGPVVLALLFALLEMYKSESSSVDSI